MYQEEKRLKVAILKYCWVACFLCTETGGKVKRTWPDLSKLRGGRNEDRQVVLFQAGPLEKEMKNSIAARAALITDSQLDPGLVTDIVSNFYRHRKLARFCYFYRGH